MTVYSPFYKDFPSRCLSLLNKYYDHAQMNNMEVTLMVSIASSGFVIPFERINHEIYKKKKTHPYSEYLDIVDKSFVSEFSDNKGLNSDWSISVNVTPRWDNINGWKGISPYSKMEEKYTVSEILCVLRNALAHGSIFVEGDKDNIINNMFFVATPQKSGKGKYWAVIVSPKDFRIFLDKWFDFISKLDFKFEEVKEDIEEP